MSGLDLRRGERVVVLCHPTPGSAAFDPNPAVTASRDVHLVGINRAGYGTSSPIPRGGTPTVHDAADDIAAVVDQLGVGSVGVAGWGTGGLVALCLAARRPDLVDRVVVFATPAPDDQLPWLTDEIRTIARGRSKLSAEAAASLLCVERDPVSAALPDVRHRVDEMLAVAFQRGTSHVAREVRAFLTETLTFDPADVEAKTLLLYGMKDPLVAYRHARWWDQRLPNSRTEMAPKSGPLVAVTGWKRALSHLAPGGLRSRSRTA